MKTIAVLIVTFVFTIQFHAQEKPTEQNPLATPFYERVVGHLDCDYCYFIALNVESETFSGKIVVENDALFHYFEKTNGFDKQVYREFVVKLLQDRRTLKLSGATSDKQGFYLVGKDIDDFSFRIVTTSQTFETVAAGGCESIVRYYFSPSLSEPKQNEKSDCKGKIRAIEELMTMPPRYNTTEQNNVIASLFEFGIALRIDDISGRPSIVKSALK